MPVLQVAQSAVNQAGRPGARAGAEVALVDEGGPDSAHRSVPGNTGAGDTAADHQQVDGLLGHLLEMAGPRPVRKGSVH